MKARVKELGAILFLVVILALSWYSGELSNAVLSRSVQLVPILDAGHGDPDGGAIAPDGTTENEINLDICLRMESILRLFYYEPVLTRRSVSGIWDESEKTIRQKKVSDMNNRVSLVNSVINGVLISIHQNSYQGNASGLQIYYKDAESEDLSQYLYNTFSERENADIRPCVNVPKDLFLFRKTNCPGVLLETGYLSSAADLALLKSDSHREWLALAGTVGFILYDHNGKGT